MLQASYRIYFIFSQNEIKTIRWQSLTLNEMKIYAADSATTLRFEWSVIESTSSVLALSDHNAHGLTSCSSYNLEPQNNYNGGVKTSKRQAEQPPRNRYYHAACLVGNYVYIYGGIDRYSPLKDLWRLNVGK